MKMLKTHWFSLVFVSKVLKNLIKPVVFVIFSIGVAIGVALATAQRPYAGLVTTTQ